MSRIVTEDAAPTDMNIMSAIYNRRAVRSNKEQPIDVEKIDALLKAAVHAPSAVDEEPWAFAIIQDKAILKRLSESAKKIMSSTLHEPSESHFIERFTQPDFKAFYDAGTLIVIYGKPLGPFVSADCWLAAENLMLAAYGMGLSTCVIGSVVAALNSPEWKKEFTIPEDMTAYLASLLEFKCGIILCDYRNKENSPCFISGNKK